MDLESNAFYFILFYLGSLKENLFTFWIKVYCFLSFSGVLVNGSRGFVLFIQFFGLLCRCSKVDNGFLIALNKKFVFLMIMDEGFDGGFGLLSWIVKGWFCSMFVLWLVLIMELWVISDYISKICGD
jgi:hypothetical protein